MEEEVMEGLEQEVRCTADGRRLDVQLSEVSGLTRSRVASLMESGCCQVDGKTVLKPGAKARPGQEVCLMIPAARPAKSTLGRLTLDRPAPCFFFCAFLAMVYVLPSWTN